MNFFARIQLYILVLFIPLAAPFVYLSRVCRRRARAEKTPRRFFMIPQLTRLGDIVCSTPVFRAVKETEPKSFVAVMSSRSQNAVGIVRHNPRIDEIFIYEDYSDNLVGLVRALRREAFDVGVSLSGTAFSSVLLWYAGIPVRIKLSRLHRPVVEYVTDWLIPIRFLYNTHQYLPEFYTAMLRTVGIDARESRKEVFTTVETERVAEALFRGCGIGEGERVVGMSVSAGNRIKEWGDGKFEFLARAILDAYPTIKILFLGAPRDAARLDAIMRNLASDRVFAATDVSLEVLPSVIKHLALFVSVDSGPMHVADALAVPLVDIIGPVCRGELTPRGAHVAVVEPDPRVDPTIFSFDRPGNPFLTKQALEQTSVDRVFKAARALLGRVG